METLIAFGHIIGSVVAVIAVGIVSALIAAWEIERNEKSARADAAIALGVGIDELEEEAVGPQLIKLASDRFSDELLRNRLSDLCGFVRTGWGWLGTVVQASVLLGVVWYTFTDKIETAIYAWWMVAVSMFFWLASIIFSLICRLLTGRYPGQARQARKALARFLDSQRAAKRRPA